MTCVVLSVWPQQSLHLVQTVSADASPRTLSNPRALPAVAEAALVVNAETERWLWGYTSQADECISPRTEDTNALNSATEVAARLFPGPGPFSARPRVVASAPLVSRPSRRCAFIHDA